MGTEVNNKPSFYVLTKTKNLQKPQKTGKSFF